MRQLLPDAAGRALELRAPREAAVFRLAAERPAVLRAAVLRAVDLRAVDLRAGDFLAADFRAAVFFAGFLPAVFRAEVFLAADLAMGLLSSIGPSRTGERFNRLPVPFGCSNVVDNLEVIALSDWNPEAYLAFADERTRPARDLLAQVPLDSPQRIYDLGCGPGNSTSLLAARYPHARVTGIDNSPAMLEAARRACPSVSFAHGDLGNWRPDDAPDLLFSNASLQWVPRHLDVMARLLGCLPAGGMLAVQMPDNLDEPSHRLMRETAEQGAWRGKLTHASATREPMPSASGYYARLKPLCRRLDIWHTIYNHPLTGTSGIAAWLSTTGLKPFIDPLADEERKRFLGEYEARLAAAYAADADGTVLLRFPRLFIAALR